MNLVERATRMLTTPATEWDVVAAENIDPQPLTMSYVVPLTLLSQLAAFIGSAFVSAMFMAAFGMHRSLPYWLVSAVLAWVLTVVAVYINAWVVNALAPTFGSKQDFRSAFKLVVFACTAAWVGGILAVIPVLGMLGAIAGGLYSIYLFYLGVPRLMATPPDKVVPYMLVSALVLIVVTMLIGLVVGGVTAAMFGLSATGMGS
ncbi:MAG: YIP1 family protein [Candidatus Eisenbacteria bacterium]|nr:YIP1 family protein [Candidatus Eisenbacteria bacterium]